MTLPDKLKGIKKMKQRKIYVLVFIIFSLILINNILAQSTEIKDYLKDQKTLQSFIDSSGQDKSAVWEESKKTEGTSLLRDSLAEESIKKIYKDRLNKDLAAGAEKMALQTLGNILYKEMEKRGLPAQLGIEIQSVDQLKAIASKAGLNLGVVLATQIESVQGFGSKDLSWSTKGKNIIGNGKVWLNIDKLPYKVNSIKYDESRKAFLLRTKDGGELVLGEGATDENGNLALFPGSADDKLNPLRTALAPFMDPKKPLGLENLIILGKGQVIWGKDGFEIKGDDVKLRFGEFTFGRKAGQTGVSSAKFSGDGITIKGIEFERAGYVRVAPTRDDFVIAFGDIKGLAQSVSFEDFKMMKVMRGGYMGMGGYESEALTSAGKISFYFDKNGQLTHVRKGDGEWVSVNDKSGSLDTFSKSSGSTVQKMIADAGKTGVSLTDFSTRYKNDKDLIGGGDYFIDSYQQNFLAMNGENFAVGGTGNIEVLRNLNSLRSLDSKDFKVKVGDIDLSFNEKGVYKGNQNSYKNSFNIGNIYATSDGKPLENPFRITKTNDGRFTIEDANFMAGKATLLGLLGTSVDLSLSIDKNDLGKIKKNVQGAWFFPESSLVSSLKDSSYSLNIDMYVPGEGTISISPDSKIKNEVVVAQLRSMLTQGLLSNLLASPLSKPELIEMFGERELQPNTATVVNSLADKFVSQVERSRISGGEYSFRINNNPGSSPSISVLMPGNRGSTINLNEGEQTLLRDILDITPIIPNLESVSYTVAGKKVPIWPGPHLEELWYRYLGQARSSTSVQSRIPVVGGFIPGKDDMDLFEGFLNKYTKKK